MLLNELTIKSICSSLVFGKVVALFTMHCIFLIKVLHVACAIVGSYIN